MTDQSDEELVKRLEAEFEISRKMKLGDDYNSLLFQAAARITALNERVKELEGEAEALNAATSDAIGERLSADQRATTAVAAENRAIEQLIQTMSEDVVSYIYNERSEFHYLRRDKLVAAIAARRSE